MNLTINKLALMVVSLLGGFWAIIELQNMGITMPLLRAILGFTLLTFVPGLLIISLFKLRNVSIGESVLYCVGSSISFLAFVSLFINLLYPTIGVVKPLSPNFLMLNLTVMFLILVGLIYMRERRLRASYNKSHFSLKSFGEEIKDFDMTSQTPFLLLAILLPLLSVLAAYMMNFYSNNALMLLLLLILAIVPIIALTKNIPNGLYPMILLGVSLSILLHNNLITDYVIGADIQITYFYSSLIKSNLSWNPEISGHNTIIAVSLVPAIYSLVLNLDLHSVFKIIYSIVYSLAPVGIFYIFRKSFGSKEAFIAGIFFCFFWRFFLDTPGKEAMAHFFLILFLMLVANTSIRKPTRVFFAILFLFSLVVSHYGTSYIILIAIGVAYAISLYIRQKKQENLISLNLVMLFGTVCVVWYLFTGQGDIFSKIVVIASHFKREIMAMFSEVEPRTVLALLTTQRSMLWEVNLLLHLVLTFFVGLGVLRLTIDIVRRKLDPTMNPELCAIAVPFFLFLCISAFIYGPSFGIDRAYYLSLVVLCPFLSAGYKLTLQFWSKMSESMSNFWKRKRQSQDFSMHSLQRHQICHGQSFNLLPISILLAILLLFNTGLIYQVAGSPVSSAFALNKESNGLAYSGSEMRGAKWINKNIIQGYVIYSDWYSQYLLFEFFPPDFANIEVFSLRPHPYKDIVLNFTDLREKSVIYIRAKSISDAHPNDSTYLSSQKVQEITTGSNKIYDNGGSKIFIVADQRNDEEMRK